MHAYPTMQNYDPTNVFGLFVMLHPLSNWSQMSKLKLKMGVGLEMGAFTLVSTTFLKHGKSKGWRMVWINENITSYFGWTKVNKVASFE